MPGNEITLRDLVAWTDLVAAGERQGTIPAGADDPLDRGVDWVITARATPPMLPTVRGGELVLLPKRVVTESALDLHLLIQELARQPVAGVVLDSNAPVASPVPMLHADRIGPELEGDLNRLLTTRRGDLLRAATEIERIIAIQHGMHAAPDALLTALADHLGLDFVVRNGSGAAVLSTTHHPPVAAHPEPGWLHRALQSNRVLMIGVLEPERAALGRFILDRIAGAVQLALDEARPAAQDHASRTQLINQALVTARHDAQGAGEMLARAGIRPEVPVRVARAAANARDRDVWPLLTAIGAPVDAGTVGEAPVWLLTGTAHPHEGSEPADGAWIAVSAPVTVPAGLEAALRQTTFLAGVRHAGLLGSSIVRFDDPAATGAIRLLYEQWGSPVLDDMVSHLIGPLIRDDPRGQLRRTLRYFLAFGGARLHTAEHLQIHRNTLTYRLHQIEDVLDADLDDPDVRLGLQLALIASELPPPPEQQP